MTGTSYRHYHSSRTIKPSRDQLGNIIRDSKDNAAKKEFDRKPFEKVRNEKNTSQIQ